MKNLTKCNILKAYALRNNEKFADHNLESCVLSPWPWPRPFLSLASRGSVLEKSVLGLKFVFMSLALKVVSSTPPLAIKPFFLKREKRELRKKTWEFFYLLTVSLKYGTVRLEL